MTLNKLDSGTSRYLPKTSADSLCAPASAARVGRASGPKWTGARCDMRSGCTVVHPTARTWRRASQCRRRVRLALSENMFDKRPSYQNLGRVHGNEPIASPHIPLCPNNLELCSDIHCSAESSVLIFPAHNARKTKLQYHVAVIRSACRFLHVRPCAYLTSTLFLPPPLDLILAIR
jgi:hypothetical protein